MLAGVRAQERVAVRVWIKSLEVEEAEAMSEELDIGEDSFDPEGPTPARFGHAVRTPAEKAKHAERLRERRRSSRDARQTFYLDEAFVGGLRSAAELEDLNMTNALRSAIRFWSDSVLARHRRMAQAKAEESE